MFIFYFKLNSFLCMCVLWVSEWLLLNTKCAIFSFIIIWYYSNILIGQEIVTWSSLKTRIDFGKTYVHKISKFSKNSRIKKFQKIKVQNFQKNSKFSKDLKISKNFKNFKENSKFSKDFKIFQKFHKISKF